MKKVKKLMTTPLWIYYDYINYDWNKYIQLDEKPIKEIKKLKEPELYFMLLFHSEMNEKKIKKMLKNIDNLDKIRTKNNMTIFICLYRLNKIKILKWLIKYTKINIITDITCDLMIKKSLNINKNLNKPNSFIYYLLHEKKLNLLNYIFNKYMRKRDLKKEIFSEDKHIKILLELYLKKNSKIIKILNNKKLNLLLNFTNKAVILKYNKEYLYLYKYKLKNIIKKLLKINNINLISKKEEVLSYLYIYSNKLKFKKELKLKTRFKFPT